MDVYPVRADQCVRAQSVQPAADPDRFGRAVEEGVIPDPHDAIGNPDFFKPALGKSSPADHPQSLREGDCF